MSAATSLRRLFFAAALGVGLAGAGALALAKPPPAGYAPDPPQRAARKQWVFDIIIERGRGRIARARSVEQPQPAATPRRIGRFAVELFIGRELLDRVRFSVPLMDEGPPEKNPRHHRRRASFERVSTRMRVQMADNDRATYALFIDRATGETLRYRWPPEADGSLVALPPLGTPPADAGPADAAGGASDASDARAPGDAAYSAEGGAAADPPRADASAAP